ncbi:hypothetical protein [Cellulosimicrobium sp. Marseille-Q4280]|uniref:hypothetical protein n=1 Tax=Cellulosimicrobium sp. Marseille-Q4280 TaxID=2937992 RepID=UPI002041C025|nr:hypothetical protein [Cellulosimicrobium sp. Marseille-Q4280]
MSSTTGTATHAPRHEPEEPRPRRWVVYTAVALVLVALGVVMIVQFSNVRANRDAREAEQKAAELHEQLVAVGIVGIDQETIEQVLGSDGGAFCTDPTALVDATANLGAANGAAGPGLRPSVVEERRLAGDRLVIEVYCPEQLDAFDEYVDSLNLTTGTTTSDDTSDDTSQEDS